MKRNKKIAAIVGSAATAVVVVGGGALALFTDSAFRNTGGFNGIVDIQVSNITLDEPDNINPGDNDHDESFVYVPQPGDPLYKEGDTTPVDISTTPHDLTFTVTNNGNKSFRTRQTFLIYAYNDKVLSEDNINFVGENVNREELTDVEKAQMKNAIERLVHNAEAWDKTNNVGPGSSVTPEQELLNGRMKDARVYSLWNKETGDGSISELHEDHTELPGKTYIGSDGKEYTNIEDLDKAVDGDGNPIMCWAVKYEFTPDIFEGCGLQAELEDRSTPNLVIAENDGKDAATKDYTYELSMDKHSENQYQGAEVFIDATFEAMQYRNTSQSDWEIVTTYHIDGYSPYDWQIAPDREHDYDKSPADPVINRDKTPGGTVKN